MHQDLVGQTADHAAIERLQRAYADVVNRRAWAELPDLFAPDARAVELDLVTSPGRTFDRPTDLAAFIGAAVARFSFFEFVILNAHVELWPDGDRDTATARVFMCELRQDAESRERSDAFGLYRDRYVRTEAGWRFARRRYRSMARFPAGDVFPLPRSTTDRSPEPHARTADEHAAPHTTFAGGGGRGEVGVGGQVGVAMKVNSPPQAKPSRWPESDSEPAKEPGGGERAGEGGLVGGVGLGVLHQAA